MNSHKIAFAYQRSGFQLIEIDYTSEGFSKI